MSDDIEKAVQVHRLNPDYYLHEEINARVDEIVDLNNPLLVIDERNCALRAAGIASQL